MILIRKSHWIMTEYFKPTHILRRIKKERKNIEWAWPISSMFVVFTYAQTLRRQTDRQANMLKSIQNSTLIKRQIIHFVECPKLLWVLQKFWLNKYPPILWLWAEKVLFSENGKSILRKVRYYRPLAGHFFHLLDGLWPWCWNDCLVFWGYPCFLIIIIVEIENVA